MKRKPNRPFKTVLICLSCTFIFMTGCTGESKPVFTDEQLDLFAAARPTDLPNASGGFVLVAGEQTITADEIVKPLVERLKSAPQEDNFDQFALKARPLVQQLITSKVINILLYNKAKAKAGDQIEEPLNNAVESEVSRFISGFQGDYTKAEEELKRMGMDWQGFRDYQKKMILVQSFMSTQLPEQKPITYSELRDYYDRTKDGSFVKSAMIKISLIDIQPAKLKLDYPNQGSLVQAKKLAAQIIERMKAGEDFGELAKKYSHGYRAPFGGSWKPVNPDSLAKPYDSLAIETEKIEPGRIAGPIYTEGHIFIVKLEDKRALTVESFEQVQEKIEARIKVQRRRKAIDEFGEKLASQAALNHKYEFTEFCLRELYQECGL